MSDDRAYLHDGETLLASMRAGIGGLLQSLARGIVEGLFFGAFVGMGVALAISAMGWSFGLWGGAIVAFFVLVLIVWQRFHLWHETKIRVTTERILVPEPGPLFHPPLHTIKWPQYQESHVGHRNFLDVLFLSRPLMIRYGTADTQKEAKFPSLRYAEDLKHFLDKVDSALRRGDLSGVRPFVAKPKGKRDVSESADGQH